MAWFGKIESLNNVNDHWELSVAFFDDNNPDKKIWRTLNFPLTVAKPAVIDELKRVGSEIQRATTLNSERVVGQIVPI